MKLTAILERAANHFIDKVRDERVKKAEAERDQAYGAVMEAAHQDINGSQMHERAQWNFQRYRLEQDKRDLQKLCAEEKAKREIAESEVIDLKRSLEISRNTIVRIRQKCQEIGIDPTVVDEHPGGGEL